MVESSSTSVVDKKAQIDLACSTGLVTNSIIFCQFFGIEDQFTKVVSLQTHNGRDKEPAYPVCHILLCP